MGGRGGGGGLGHAFELGLGQHPSRLGLGAGRGGSLLDRGGDVDFFGPAGAGLDLDTIFLGVGHLFTHLLVGAGARGLQHPGTVLAHDQDHATLGHVLGREHGDGSLQGLLLGLPAAPALDGDQPALLGGRALLDHAGAGRSHTGAGIGHGDHARTVVHDFQDRLGLGGPGELSARVEVGQTAADGLVGRVVLQADLGEDLAVHGVDAGLGDDEGLVLEVLQEVHGVHAAFLEDHGQLQDRVVHAVGHRRPGLELRDSVSRQLHLVEEKLIDLGAGLGWGLDERNGHE